MSEPGESWEELVARKRMTAELRRTMDRTLAALPKMTLSAARDWWDDHDIEIYLENLHREDTRE